MFRWRDGVCPSPSLLFFLPFVFEYGMGWDGLLGFQRGVGVDRSVLGWDLLDSGWEILPHLMDGLMRVGGTFSLLGSLLVT